MWWRRRAFDPFEEINRIFEEIERHFERSFRGLRFGEFDQPLYYGVSIRVTPEGEPEIRTFGNIEATPHGIVASHREPFTDVIKDEKNNEVIITVEMPGVDKEDIKINATEREVEIRAEKGDRKYFKRVSLDVDVDPKSAKAKYNNGVLEIKLRIARPVQKGHEIKVE